MGDSERQRLIVVDKLPSTNDYLKERASNFKPLDEFTAIMAINQTAGRGQRDNKFLGTPGESLTFSFILFPTELPLADLFYINIAVSLGIQDWLLTKTSSCHIKWPNDIIVNNKKVGGVLIENAISSKSVKHCIVGIGINAFQTALPAELAHKATSLLMNIPNINQMTLEDICGDIIRYIKPRYQQVHKLANRESLLADYNRCLYRKGIESNFLVEGQKVGGTISHVDSNGLIHIEHEDRLQSYYLKDIAMVL